MLDKIFLNIICLKQLQIIGTAVNVRIFNENDFVIEAINLLV